jgi:peptidoglycan/xylan/chitin deacetylase (PgdA/CDA1 family)
MRKVISANLRIFILFIYLIIVHVTIVSQISFLEKNIKNDSLDLITISRWKYDARSSLNISFDDNLPSQNKISRIFDKYNFKASFFVISSNMIADSVLGIFSRGHEIGSHTVTHQAFSTLDSTTIDFEISKSKEMIENLIGTKCVSFAEPEVSYTALSKKLSLSYYLFNPVYTEFSNNTPFFIYSNSTISQFLTYIKSGVENKSMMEIIGHGMDGDGFNPITQNNLIQLLDIVKSYSNSGDIWVSTIKEIEQYNSLYKEIAIDKRQSEDTLVITVRNYDSEKYKDMDTSPISINIPNTYFNRIKSLTSGVEIKELADKYVVTFDLQKDTALTLIRNVVADLTTPIDSVFKDSSLMIYPNPVVDWLYFYQDGNIFDTEIYSLEGKLISREFITRHRIDVSKLPSGFYILKMNVNQNNSNIKVRSKFLKL